MRAAAVVGFIVGFAFCIFWMTDGLEGLFSGAVGVSAAVVVGRARMNRNA